MRNNQTREIFVIRVMGEGIKSPSPPGLRLFKIDKNNKEIPIGHPMYFNQKDELYNRIIGNSDKIIKYLLKGKRS